MPELPEVETTRQGLLPFLPAKIEQVDVRAPKLRYPLQGIEQLTGSTFTNIERRSKYLLFQTSSHTTLLSHLGMTGRFAVLDSSVPLAKADHVIFHLDTGQQLRYHDPRRFGIMLPIPTVELHEHPLLVNLGPEPLTNDFTATTLHSSLKNRKTPIKVALMDSKVVVGVGNIYASESLFRAGIRPTRAANKLSKAECTTLVHCVKETLAEAIAAGGSSLKDFAHTDGKLGYFQAQFNVYGRADKPCHTCGTPIEKLTQAQRSTFYCPQCQPR